jgi:hypothetical protein
VITGCPSSSRCVGTTIDVHISDQRAISSSVMPRRLRRARRRLLGSSASTLGAVEQIQATMTLV